jgi:hypothetical protein
MVLRRLFAVVALVGAWAVGVALLRRTTGARRERVDLYFEDGSMQSLTEGAADATRLLPLARTALTASRGG